MLNVYLPPLRRICLVWVKKIGSNGFVVSLIRGSVTAILLSLDLSRVERQPGGSLPLES